MKTVWKFPIRPDSIKDRIFWIEVNAPLGAKPLHVGIQDGQVFLWMEVDPKQPIHYQKPLACIGTGFGMVGREFKYFQTLIEGAYVWHFYRHEP